MRPLSTFFLLGGLVVVIGLACQRVGPTEAPGKTAAFLPGSIATQLARPTQEGTPATGEIRNPDPTLTSESPSDQLARTPVTTPQPLAENDRYYLAAKLFDEHQLDVHQVITYTNRTGSALAEIWLVVEAGRQDDVFILQEMSWNGVVVETAQPQGGIWQIELPSEFNPGETGILVVSYRLDLPANGGVLGYSRRQINFGDWYVRIPPFQPATGWLVHSPGASGEHNVYDNADYFVQLDLGDGDPGLVVAASAPGQACGRQICYSMLNSRGFAWSASKEYQVLEAVENGILLRQFVFPEHTTAGLAALDVARQAVKVFEEKFGEYPHPSLAMVEAGFFDGMEYPGMFFLGEEYYTSFDGSPEGYLTALTVHETAHQWWFSLVGNDQALEPWLDEALSTYSELIYYQGIHPDLVDWWWDYRVVRFQPGGNVDSSIYDHAGFRPYVNAVYLRGAQFLHELRILMGDEAFEAFLAAYFRDYQGKIASGVGFFSLAGQFADPEKLQGIRDLFFSP